jgi:hypothetical protein
VGRVSAASKAEAWRAPETALGRGEMGESPSACGASLGAPRPLFRRRAGNQYTLHMRWLHLHELESGDLGLRRDPFLSGCVGSLPLPF